ncbi:transcriptional coactivator p15/PC4 family protein [candidate division WOR-3 bacterium]|nr:transcriptional coactivator p15/PC4 family protein [candidate division WOR-3 bacterium]
MLLWTVKAQIGEYNGHSIIDFRVWVEDKQGKEIPTKKGLTISPGRLQDFYELVKTTVEASKLG